MTIVKHDRGTADGQNRAPADRWFNPLFIGFHPCQLAQHGFCPCTVGLFKGNPLLLPHVGFPESNGLVGAQAKGLSSRQRVATELIEMSGVAAGI